MSKINLHMHSNHSLDGKLSPNEVINKALASEITYLSITDYDNCYAYLELALNNTLNSGTLVYGMKADTIINDVTYDILCYGFELENVRTWTREQYGIVATRQVKIYRNLVEKCKSLKLVLAESVPYNPEEKFAHAAIFRMLNISLKNKAF